MASTTQLPTRAAIEYPDCDGEPMSDNTLQYDWMVLIEEGLAAIFDDNPDVLVAGNLLWYPVEGEPSIRAAPDAMVVFGRPKGRRGSYKQWEEANIAPHVVFEVLAPGNRPDELESKFEFYEKYRVQEYYIYDPDDGMLEGWLRAGDHLEKVPDMAGFVSPLLGIRFEPGEGADNLKIVGPDGEPFVIPREAIKQRNSERQQKEAERQRAEAERQRADAAQQRAEDERQQKVAERQRADAAQQRAERLAARLRDLGIEPD